MNAHDFIPDPEVLKLLGWFAALLALRDLSKAAVRRLKAKVKATPSKDDDWLADVADVVLVVVERIPLPPLPWAKKKAGGEE